MVTYLPLVAIGADSAVRRLHDGSLLNGLGAVFVLGRQNCRFLAASARVFLDLLKNKEIVIGDRFYRHPNLIETALGLNHIDRRHHMLVVLIHTIATLNLTYF